MMEFNSRVHHDKYKYKVKQNKNGPNSDARPHSSFACLKYPSEMVTSFPC